MSLDPATPLTEKYQYIITKQLELLDLCKCGSIKGFVCSCVEEILIAEGQVRRIGILSDSIYQALMTSLTQLFRKKASGTGVVDDGWEPPGPGDRAMTTLQFITILHEHDQATKSRVLKEKYKDLISRFYEIAARKVGLLDDYGDEQWELLGKEIRAVVRKVAKQENVDETTIGEMWGLSTFLKESFEEYYRERKLLDSPKYDVSKLTGRDFEAFLISLLKRNGFESVTGTQATGDQGADIIAEKDGKKIVIQAKRHSSAVGNGAVQEISAAVAFYGADEGWVITNSSFTKAAKELAQRTRVRLLDGHDLRRFSEWVASLKVAKVV